MKAIILDHSGCAQLYAVTEELPKMEVIKSPLYAKACVWDVTNAYCDKRDKSYTHWSNGRNCTSVVNPAKLKSLRALPIVGNVERKQLTVDINGSITIYQVGKKGEYFANGIALTKTLESLATGTGNKIQIY